MLKDVRGIAFLLLAEICQFFWQTGYAGAVDDHLFVTGRGMEIDRCASAWLIKRYVDPEARFNFLQEKELMESRAKQFDTPYAQWRRTHRFSTFESIRNHFGIEDDKVAAIARMIHHIEINFWNGTGKGLESTFENNMKHLISQSPDNKEALDACFSFLDKNNPNR